jgi:prevent-host-death family protein
MNVSVYEAKTHLSRLLARAEAGEEIVISRHGRPVARLGPIRPARRPRKLGLLKGRIRIGRNFDAPLPEDVLAAFEGDST